MTDAPTGSTDHLTVGVDALDDRLGSLAEAPFNALVPVAGPAQLQTALDALGAHGRFLARWCVGLAVVSDDASVRARVIRRAGVVPFPVTALPDGAQAAGWLAGQAAIGPHGIRPGGGGRAVGSSPWLDDYVDAHQSPPADPVFAALGEATRSRFGAAAGMNVSENQGRFLKLLVELAGARHVVEIGTFTGASALWLARGLPGGGSLTCFELDERYVEVGRRAWAEAGVADRITVVIGPAAERLAEIPAEPAFDLAFIDADKESYGTYLELVLERLRPGGVVAVDNTLWGGAVADPRIDDERTETIRAFNDRLAASDDLDVVVLPVGDGLTLVRPRREG